MRQVTVFLLILACTIILSGCLQPTLDEMQVCERNSDCILVNEGCCDCSSGGKRISINRSFVQQYQQMFVGQCVGVECPAVISDDYSCSNYAIPVCTDGRCHFEPTESVITIYYRGVQCAEWPWGGFGATPGVDVGRYYKENYDIEIRTFFGVENYITCEACGVCPSSEEFSVAVYESYLDRMLALGWTLESSAS